MKIHRYVLFLAVLVTVSSQAQIKNIEKLRIWSGDRHWSFDSGLNFRYNNTDGNYVFQIGARAGVLYKFKDKKDKFNNKLRKSSKKVKNLIEESEKFYQGE